MNRAAHHIALPQPDVVESDSHEAWDAWDQANHFADSTLDASSKVQVRGQEAHAAVTTEQASALEHATRHKRA